MKQKKTCENLTKGTFFVKSEKASDFEAKKVSSAFSTKARQVENDVKPLFHVTLRTFIVWHG